MFKKVLVPVDQSEQSRSIVRWAVSLAKATKAELTLLTVIDTEDIRIVESGARGVERPEASDGIIGTLAAQLKDQLEREADELRATGVSISVRVAAGAPAKVIVDEAKWLDVDLIAMSTRRDSALARGVLGSVTDRVLHSTSTPLMILQPEELTDEAIGAGFIRNIIVPLDGSELSETAVPPALELARATGAELVFTEVVRLPVYGMDMGGVGYGAVQMAEDLDTKLEEEASAKYLAQCVANAETAGVKASAQVRVGNPSVQLVDEALTREGSVIVMATHGTGGIKRWVIGSVTDKTIRSSHRPVLVIPPQST